MTLTEAQVVRLASLETDDGRLNTAVVIQDAKKKSSPLHSLFQWDLGKAAYAHWTQTAREIIGVVTVLRETHERTIKVPKYAKDPDTKSGYRSTDALRVDPRSSRQSLIYTLEVAAGHIRRAHDLAAALGLQDQVDDLLQQVLGLKRSLEKAA